ncbi:N-acetyltransferase [Hoyosella sp. G463]|uniref:N-acetyltransferase n=1 Tax=Lolliginicoccus lacisalsi TaxID=2742202 RepID=A0A927PL24_9ACTN|nr:GNAT family N-acetyltransferase [Lolliginicoccus lacisalsi]MBD8504952.1 N-acetyltransferase [Lolliginicoccus lacisalsi]
MAFTLRDNDMLERYELIDGGSNEVAGSVEYSILQGRISLTHTEIGKAYAGQGLASQLLEQVLDEARERELAVLPFCPFAQRYIQKHPSYADLVPAQLHGKFGLQAKET